MPPTTGAIRAGRAFVEVFAENSQLVRGLRQAETKIRAFGAKVRNIGLAMMAAGAAIITPLVLAVRTFTEIGDRLSKMSQRTGVSVEALSALSFAAEQSGASIEALELSIRVMQRTIDDAGRGLSTARDALNRLGLSFAMLRALAPEQQFLLIADRLSYLQDASERAALAMAIFGRSGTAMLPLIAHGAAGIRALMEEAAQLGIVMTTKEAEAAVRWADAQNRLTKSFQMALARAGGALIAPLERLAKVLQNIGSSVNTWIERNGAFIRSVALLGVTLMGAGIFLTHFGLAMQGLASLVGLIRLPIALLHGALGLLLTRLGLVSAAVVALGVMVARTSGAAGRLGEAFGHIKGDAKTAFDGIRDALARGDIEAALRVLGLGLQMVWQDVIGGLKKAWIDFLSWTMQVSVTFNERLQTVWETLVDQGAKDLVEVEGGIKQGLGHIKEALAGRGLGVLETGPVVPIPGFNETPEQKELEAKRRAAETLHQRKLKAITDESEWWRHAITTSQDKDIAALTAQLEKAREEYRKAVEAAKGAPAPALPGGAGGAAVPDLEAMVQEVARSTARGTFYAFAVAGLDVTNDAAKRTAQATERTAKNTDALLRRGALTFT